MTIINNNVSNYINNVIHNHVPVPEEKTEDNRFNKERVNVETGPLHSTQKDASQGRFPQDNENRNKERSTFVPLFIHNKRRATNNSPGKVEEMISSKQSSNTNNSEDHKMLK